jgi:hypothetical protein
MRGNAVELMKFAIQLALLWFGSGGAGLFAEPSLFCGSLEPNSQIHTGALGWSAVKSSYMPANTLSNSTHRLPPGLPLSPQL